MSLPRKPSKPAAGTPENPLPAMPNDLLDRFPAEGQTMSASMVFRASHARRAVASPGLPARHAPAVGRHQPPQRPLHQDGQDRRRLGAYRGATRSRRQLRAESATYYLSTLPPTSEDRAAPKIACRILEFTARPIRSIETLRRMTALQRQQSFAPATPMSAIRCA